MFMRKRWEIKILIVVLEELKFMGQGRKLLFVGLSTALSCQKLFPQDMVGVYSDWTKPTCI